MMILKIVMRAILALLLISASTVHARFIVLEGAKNLGGTDYAGYFVVDDSVGGKPDMVAMVEPQHHDRGQQKVYQGAVLLKFKDMQATSDDKQLLLDAVIQAQAADELKVSGFMMNGSETVSTAMKRAEAVRSALVMAGVPANKITIEQPGSRKVRQNGAQIVFYGRAE